ncbi:MAG: GNAT family N-acetyltransferase [Clostridia bacterium]|nr:GNAT family N-acetyltransferase [Clostridia bacterium]
MKLTVCGNTFYSRRMTNADAAAVCRWRYSGRQEIYNTEDTPESVRSFMDGWHFALSRKFGGEIEAFVCFGESAGLPLPELAHIYRDESFTDIALGLRPDLCGKGLGQSVAAAAMALAYGFFPDDGFRVTVAKDNAPAQRIYRALGFETLAAFSAEVIYPDKDGNIRTRMTEMEILTAAPCRRGAQKKN